MTDTQMQMAVDSMHNAQYGDSRYGSQNPYAITVNSNGDVVVSGASKTPGPDARARGIQYMQDNGMEVDGSRQAITSYSCDDCVTKQETHNTTNVTGTAADHGGKYARPKIGN